MFRRYILGGLIATLSSLGAVSGAQITHVDCINDIQVYGRLGNGPYAYFYSANNTASSCSFDSGRQAYDGPSYQVQGSAQNFMNTTVGLYSLEQTAYLSAGSEANNGTGSSLHAYALAQNDLDFTIAQAGTADLTVTMVERTQADFDSYTSIYSTGQLWNWAASRGNFQDPSTFSLHRDLAAGSYTFDLNAFVDATSAGPADAGGGLWVSYDFKVQSVPEPTTMSGLVIGALALARRRKARR